MTESRTNVGLFSVRDLNKDLAIGVDVGGTKIYGMLIDSKGRVLNKIKVDTQADKSKQVILNNIIKVIKKLMENKVIGIGIGVPGIVDSEGNLILIPNVNKLNGINLKKLVEKKFLVKTRIENDANCFALSELRYGAGRNCKNIVGVILGTGIGSGIIINGHLYIGANGGAGEIWHNKIFDGKDFESMCGGPALVNKYKKLTGKTAMPVDILKDKNVKKEWHENLAKGFAGIINTLNPEIIVVGGGLAQALDFKELNKLTKGLVIPTNKVNIVAAQVGYESGVLGAASLVL